MASYLIYLAIIILIPIYAQMKVKSTYKKYTQVSSSSGMTGAEVARRILDDNGKIDLNKFNPITYDPVHHTYRKIGDVVGKAFSDGNKLK